MTLVDKRKYLLGAVYAFFGAILFSAKAVFIKLAYQYDVDSISLLALRMCLALPIYITIYIVNNRKNRNDSVSRKSFFYIILLGMVGYYLASYFDFYGLKYISASLERLILFVYPTLVVLIAAVFYKSKITWIQVLAIFLTYIGILIIFIDNLNIGEQNNIVKGGVLIFISALTYAIYLVGSQGLIKKTGAIRFTAIAMIVSSICVILHYLFTHDIQYLLLLHPNVYWIALAIAIISTVIPSFLISKGIDLIGSSNTSIIAGIGPVSTLVLAYLFLDERITLLQGVGTLVVIVAVLIVSLKKDK